MNRYFVPIVVAALVSGLAVGLIGGVVARSPETHANVRPAGYDRTVVTTVGEEIPFKGIGLDDPELARTDNVVENGRVLFFAYGCASCHGLRGQGGAVGPVLTWAGEFGAAELGRLLRGSRQDVPEGMPWFRVLTEQDVADLSAFLRTEFQFE